ncbi:hypothetical protein SETIT_9G275100v2 [Setaria italica]|uniref:Uncharacterized protein n=1 Tax=Setaria italica TaxID=4555 RepID=A0A368SL79_SETIT|nr:hypothetical protein SETIT_9G275100v2 [Setaria italica]
MATDLGGRKVPQRWQQAPWVAGIKAEILKIILGVVVPNSSPDDLQSSTFLDYVTVQPTSATSSRSEVSLGGLQEAAELRQQVVEYEQMLSDLKMKAQASDVAMKM